MSLNVQIMHVCKYLISHALLHISSKGPCYMYLATLPKYDIVKCTVVDYVHCVLLGVKKMVLGLWFNSEHFAELWYCGKKVSTRDERLAKIKPPNYYVYSSFICLYLSLYFARISLCVIIYFPDVLLILLDGNLSQSSNCGYIDATYSSYGNFLKFDILYYKSHNFLNSQYLSTHYIFGHNLALNFTLLIALMDFHFHISQSSGSS